jgi:hypothetical protein
VTDDDTPKLDRELFIAMNDSGETEYGSSMEQACRRLRHYYTSNMIRVVTVMVHMAPPAVENCGDVIIPDAAGSVTRFDTDH